MVLSSFKQFGAGIEMVHYFVLNSDNYPIGSVAGGPTAGAAAGSGMARLLGAQTVPIELLENENVFQQGDNKNQGAFTFPAAETPQFVMTMAFKDMVFDALVNGTNIVDIAGTSAVGATQLATEQPTMGMIVQRRARRSTGALAWDYIVVLNAIITSIGAAPVESRSLSNHNYAVLVNNSTREFSGRSFSSGVHGKTSEQVMSGNSDNPLYLHTFVGNGSNTDYTLPYELVSGGSIDVRQNGVLLTGGGVDYTLSGTSLTLPAGTSGDIFNVVMTVAASDFEV